MEVQALFENPYLEKIGDLRSRKIAELVIEREEFMLFREAWLNQADKSLFVETETHFECGNRSILTFGCYHLDFSKCDS